jgi:hypothetical protein
MSDFVEQCRQEWRRLGVPDPLAEEMAADLASDLADAEAEGVTAEELLGSSAFDPRSFAASWAGERGIIPEPSSRASARRRPPILLGFTALAAITVIVAALLLATGEPKVSLVGSRSPEGGFVVRSGPNRQIHQAISTSAAAPIEWILLFLSIVALGVAAWVWSSWSRTRQPSAPV